MVDGSKPFTVERKLRTGGGTFVICIPPIVAKNLGWKKGDDLILEVYSDKIVVKQKRESKK